ncbi:MAG: FkbM family methyltransferase [Rhizobiaceae bacterium]
MTAIEVLEREAKNLYARLQSGTLSESDILPVAQARFEDQGRSGYLAVIRNDVDEYKKHFASHMEPLSPFRIFSEDSTILDVGAHWGYSVVGMRHQGAKANILSIEALPQNAIELASLKEVEHGKYDYLQVAATEEACELNFYLPAVNGVAVAGLNSTGGTLNDYFASHLASLTTTYLAKEGEPDRLQVIVHKVAGLPIDTIVKDRGIADQVVAIKMDVEGHEAPALRGARNLIARQLPLVMIEEANRNPGVVAEMTSQGYDHYELQNRKFVKVNEYSWANDGYWLHPQRLEFYRQSGLMA